MQPRVWTVGSGVEATVTESLNHKHNSRIVVPLLRGSGFAPWRPSHAPWRPSHAGDGMFHTKSFQRPQSVEGAHHHGMWAKGGAGCMGALSHSLPIPHHSNSQLSVIHWLEEDYHIQTFSWHSAPLSKSWACIRQHPASGRHLLVCSARPDSITVSYSVALSTPKGWGEGLP